MKNEDILRYDDENGENVSYLSYQLEIAASQSDTLTANANVDNIINIIDTYLKGDRYKCLRRVGGSPKKPLQIDNNVMIGYLRYECNLDIKTNTIYRRY